MILNLKHAANVKSIVKKGQESQPIQGTTAGTLKADTQGDVFVRTRI
jgi:hypothetical protein